MDFNIFVGQSSENLLDNLQHYVTESLINGTNDN